MPREWMYNGGQGTPVVEEDEELQVKHVAVSTRQDFTEDEQKQARDNIGASSKSDLDIHLADKENPHEVTAEQVGAYTKEQVDDKLSKKADKTDLDAFETKADAKAKANTYGVDLSSTKMSSGTYRINITRPNLS